jgi:hypothetical protein
MNAVEAGLWMRHIVGRRIEVGWPLPPDALLPGVDPAERLPAVTYVCQPGARPYLHPVRAATTAQVLTQDRPTDHPWQHGIFTALHGVAGLDFWTEHRTPAAQRGTIIHERIEAGALEAGAARWRSINAWLAPGARRLLTEVHEVAVHTPTEHDYCIDLTWRLRTDGGAVTIDQYSYGGLAVRLVHHPDRQHRNSEGLTGAATSEGRAAWCDVCAPFDGSPAWTADDTLAGAWHGVAVLDHPQNLGYPSTWRVDGQGLINPSPSLQGAWRIEADQDQVFRYRLVVHAGQADPYRLGSLHAAFARS